MPETLPQRVNAVPWADYESACGFDSTEIPNLIIALNDEDTATAMTAINRLWNVVCHQSNVGSNAVPTLPFLIDRLHSASPELQSKILDIIYPFACHARMCSKRQHGLELNGWRKDLAESLLAHRPILTSFLESPVDEVVDWAELIDEELDAVAIADENIG